MRERQRVSSGTRWEPIAGYSRAIRIGDVVHVSGTTATDESGNVIGVGSARIQARQTLANLRTALEQLGAGIEHVVRTRIYVTDIGQWEEVARAHGEMFGAVRPATTLVQVAALIDPEMLVEIEAEALID